MSASDAQRAAPGCAAELAADLAPGGARGRRGGAPGRSRAAARRRPRGRCRGRPAPRARARRTAAPRGARTPPAAARPGSSAPSSESVTRRSTEVASSASRVARVEPVEVERGELLHDGRQDRVLGRVRALADRRGRELQRQRVAAHEAVDPLGLRLVEPGAAQHLGGVGGRQRAERHRAQQLAERRAPDGAGRVARGEDDARVRGQRGQEASVRSQPSSSRRRSAVSTTSTTTRRVGGPRLRPTAARKPCGVGSTARPSTATTRRAALGRLGAERPQQRRLARAGDAVDDGHERPVVVEQREQRASSASRPTSVARALGQQRSERPAHGVRRCGGLGVRARRRSSPRRA